MRDGLLREWKEGLERVEGWKEGADPAPVLEALGYALVLKADGTLDDRPEQERKTMRRRGRKAVAAANERMEAEPSEREDLSHAVHIARAALGVLGDKRGLPLEAAPQDLTAPSPRRVLRMLQGELDGLAAGTCALHLLRDPVARGQLQALKASHGDEEPAEVETHGQSSQPLEPIRAAAAAAEEMRAPGEGILIAELDDPPVEAILFRDLDATRLAVYARDPVPVRLTARGLETETMRPGYWLGRITPTDTAKLDCDLHVGEEVWQWKVDL